MILRERKKESGYRIFSVWDDKDENCIAETDEFFIADNNIKILFSLNGEAPKIETITKWQIPVEANNYFLEWIEKGNKKKKEK